MLCWLKYTSDGTFPTNPKHLIKFVGKTPPRRVLRPFYFCFAFALSIFAVPVQYDSLGHETLSSQLRVVVLATSSASFLETLFPSLSATVVC